MSDHSLPEDLSSWPSDPWQLLGVGHDITPNELRRAYTRLIRMYKPEQFPDHFRRIREAYEMVLGQVEFYQMIRKHTSESEDAAPPDDAATGAPAVVSQPWRKPAADVEELDQLWQRACAGEEAAVYRRLVEMHEGQPGRTDVLLRLYWLLALTPELDANRSPCDWLAQGLRAGGLAGPLWELYRREIGENPEEAITERCTRLLQMPAGAGPLADLAEVRWQAAARLGNWQVIDDDMDTLRDRLAVSDVETWLRLVMVAAERLAMFEGTEPEEMVQDCLNELNRHSHLHTSMAEGMDRLELQLDAASAYHREKQVPRSGVPSALTRLVGLSLSRSQAELRPALMEYLSQMVRDPKNALRELDGVGKRASPVLAQFSNVLVQFRGYAVPYYQDGRPREMLARIVQEFFDDTEYTIYTNLRPQLLDLCLREVIFPEVVAELAEDDHLANQIMSDWPLRCVCLGCYLFWV